MAQNPANVRTVCISRIRELNFNTAYKSHKSLAGVFMFLQFPRLGIHASPGLEQRQFLCGCRRQHPRFSSTTSPPQPTSRSMIRTLWVQLVPSSTGSTTMVRLWASSQTPTVCRWLGWHSNYTRAAASPNRALPQQIKTISKQSPVPRKAAPQPPDAIGAARSLCSGPPSGRFPRFAGLGVW